MKLWKFFVPFIKNNFKILELKPTFLKVNNSNFEHFQMFCEIFKFEFYVLKQNKIKIFIIAYNLECIIFKNVTSLQSGGPRIFHTRRFAAFIWNIEKAWRMKFQASLLARTPPG